MFRTFLVAVLSVLALSSVGVGVAVAATPAPAKAGDSCVLTVGTGGVADVLGHKNWSGICVALSVDVHVGNGDHNQGGHHNGDGADCVGDQAPNIPGCQRGGPVYHGPVYRDCNDARGHGYYNVRRGDSRYNDSWDRNRDGVACDDGDLVVVSNDGDCVTYATARDSIRNYGLAYNRYRTQYNGDWSRMSRNVHDRDDLARLYSQSRRYSNEGWNQTRLSNLRTVCKDTSPTVTIVNEAPPATIINSAPAATYSAPAPQVSTVPSGGAATGGSDEAHFSG